MQLKKDDDDDSGGWDLLELIGQILLGILSLFGD